MHLLHIKSLVDKCPKCEKTLDIHVLGLCTWLGPAITICRWCGEKTDSGRVEWREMNLPGRVWFFGMTLAYAGIMGFLGGYSFEATRDV
jgi:hypothetical protein